MIKSKVPLGNYITPYSVKNKNNEDIPVYSVTNSEGFCRDYFSKEVASKDKTTYKIVPKGCFAYNPSRINVGSIDWQREEERVIVSPLYNVFSISEELDAQFLYYYLKSDMSLHYIKELASGSVRDNLKLETLMEFPIPELPLSAQKKISSILDNLTEAVSIANLCLGKLDQLVKSRFVEMFGDILCNDKGWPIYTLDTISSSRLGKMLDAKRNTGKNSFPYLANFNVQWFEFDLSELHEMDFDDAEREEFSLNDGDLLITEGGEVGRCAIWHNEVTNCYFQKALHRVRCDKNVILPEYLAWWFKFHSDFNGFEDIVGGKATIAHLPGVKLKKLQIEVPDINVQKDFVSFWREIDKSKLAVKECLKKAEYLKSALMQEYFG